jgi:hypothetical protein
LNARFLVGTYQVIGEQVCLKNGWNTNEKFSLLIQMHNKRCVAVIY